MSEWLELELAETLAPRRAPHELWNRVNQANAAARQAERRPDAGWQASARLAFWPVAALVVLGTVTAWGLVDRHQPMDFEKLALADLQTSELAALDTSDAADVSGWLTRNVGVEVNIPQSAAAEISGARIVTRGGVKMGEVFYKVKGTKAALLVAKPDTGLAVKAVAAHGHRTWQAHGATYTLACAAPESEHLECLLCHLAL